MDFFFILTAFGVFGQILFVDGLHASSATPSGREYQDQRVAARSGPRSVFPTRAAYTAQRRQPRFRPNPRPDARAFRTYMRNYQSLQDRNVIRPIFSQPLRRLLVHRPHVHLHQRPPTLRRVPAALPEPINIPAIKEGIQPLPNKMRTDMVPDIDGGQGLQEAKKNSLLKLLEERRPVIRDENDVILVRRHLIKINQIRSNVSMDKEQMLEKQVEYIENITDSDIQREVLKIFVKDMVEKSGFLSQNASSVQDIDALRGLVDKISSVTDKFSKRAQTVAKDPWKMFTNVNDSNISSGEPSTTTDKPSASSENNLRKRIINALSIYDRDAHIPRAQNNSVGRSGLTFQGRPRSDKSLASASHPSAGMSIFGDIGTGTSTQNAQTTEIKRDSVLTEPLGGDNAYWTHLRAGLVDMLCNLCRQRRHQSCIRRYCSNDIIRTETETPSPAVEQTVP